MKMLKFALAALVLLSASTAQSEAVPYTVNGAVGIKVKDVAFSGQTVTFEMETAQGVVSCRQTNPKVRMMIVPGDVTVVERSGGEVEPVQGEVVPNILSCYKARCGDLPPAGVSVGDAVGNRGAVWGKVAMICLPNDIPYTWPPTP